MSHRELYYDTKVHIYRLHPSESRDGGMPPGEKVCIVQQKPSTITSPSYLIKPPPGKEDSTCSISLVLNPSIESDSTHARVYAFT